MRFFTLFALLLSLACSGDQTATAHPVTPPANGGEPVETETPEEAPVEAPEETANVVVGTDECVTDADCMPAACCHATACVAAANAPSCADAMCTQDCRYNTLDCGGGCLCHEGHCAARLSEVPAAIRESMESTE